MGAKGNCIYIKDGIIHLMAGHHTASMMWTLPFRGCELTLKVLQDAYEWKGEYGDDVLLDDVSCEGAILVNEDSKEVVFGPSMAHFDMFFLPFEERILDRDSSITALIFKHCWKDLVEPNWPGWRIKVANKADFAVCDHIEIDFDKIPELHQLIDSEVATFSLTKHDTYIYLVKGFLFQYFNQLFEVSGTPEARVIKYRPEAISLIDKNSRTRARKEAENVEYVLGLLL